MGKFFSAQGNTCILLLYICEELVDRREPLSLSLRSFNKDKVYETNVRSKLAHPSIFNACLYLVQ